MNCQNFQENLFAYLDGVMTSQEREVCRQHLSSCEECRSQSEAAAHLHERMQRRGFVTSGPSLADPVMAQIRRQEAANQHSAPVEIPVREKLRRWRWSFGMSAVAACLLLFVMLGTTNTQAIATEIMMRGANAMARIRSIHLAGRIRTTPGDNFSAIDPGQEFVPIEIWKEFEPALRWKVEKTGRIAVMDGKETMLFIKPDRASKFPTPSSSAFDTGWLHAIANLSHFLHDEAGAMQKNGWKTSVIQQKDHSGRGQSVVTIEARTGFAGDDYLKNKFLCSTDTRRVYVFDRETGVPVSAAIHLLDDSGEDKLLFELTLIEANSAITPETFQLALPQGVAWAEKMKILPDNEKYVAMSSEQAARAFFEACEKGDWQEAGKFCTVTGSLKNHYGGMKLLDLGEHFRSAISLINGAEFVPYKIQLKDGSIRNHNLALKRDPETRRWFLDGGF